MLHTHTAVQGVQVLMIESEGITEQVALPRYDVVASIMLWGQRVSCLRQQSQRCSHSEGGRGQGGGVVCKG